MTLEGPQNIARINVDPTWNILRFFIQEQKFRIVYQTIRCLSRLGTLSKPRRRRQRHQTKVLMRKTLAVHVRYKSLYISLPSAVKQERDMTKFCVVWGTRTTTANFSFFHLELNAFVAYLAWARSKSHWPTEQIKTIANLVGKIYIHFWLGVVVVVVVVAQAP